MKTETRLFLDTEFTGLHQKTTLISLALINEAGDKSMYIEFTDYDKSQVDSWLEENVINNLILSEESHGTFATSCTGDHWNFRGLTTDGKMILSQWLKQFDSVKIWSDCLAYDWVLFCELFGGGMSLPENVSYIPLDICTFFELNGTDPDVNREQWLTPFVVDAVQIFDGLNIPVFNRVIKHNSLWDALVIRECYRNLVDLSE